MEPNKNIKVCHFSSVHSIHDTRVFSRECVSLARYFDVTLIAIGNFTGHKQGVRIIGIPKAKTKLERILGTTFRVFISAIKTEADIFHIHDAEMLPFALLLGMLGKNVIYDIHENTKQDILLKPWLKPNLKAKAAGMYDALLKFSSRLVHYIPVVANEQFLPIFHVKPMQYTIIQNFADVDEMLKYRVEDRLILPDNHIFYVGMIKDMYYDFNVLIEAIYQLKQKGFIVFVHAVGYFGANVKHDFEDNTYWKEVKDQIHFYGKLSMDSAYRISMQCKLGICLKNQPEEMLVSHERKFFEYMAVALPSVFFESKIYKYINDEYKIGEAIDLKSAVEMAYAIQKILSNEDEYRLMQANCIKASEEKYNWKSQEEILVNLYERLIRN
ncbi:MAG: glycosyltransferase [Bacteroidetes bacterium]|nr:glycosyltransferase [Bacteroidota bacterium]